ncbi:hypothetical protein NDU88_004150 [Pleurodeles waltl]|uniref:Uncharacterized protein n=1 Tax=Pleurodeles waltl TaxID=8319 RepID=A0AAV7VHX6_PLEWA|nr:hypothetical protein NDU88_004150 [Pleurodeles waltl]
MPCVFVKRTISDIYVRGLAHGLASGTPMVKGLLGARGQREHHGGRDSWETERQAALFWGAPGDLLLR